MKYDRNPPRQKFSLTPTPTKPFEIIHVDTFTIKNQKFLTLLHKFSKYGQAYPLDSSKAIHISKALIKFMTHHGIPKLLVLDNGSELKNNIMKDLTSLHKIEVHYITPLNPNSNSAIERFHSTLIEHIRVLNETKKELPITDLMPYAILGYNHSIHSATKQCPINVITGHLDVQDPFNIDVTHTLYSNYINEHKNKTLEIYKHLNQKMKTEKEKNIAKQNDKRETPLPYTTNTLAYHKTRARNKIHPRFKAVTVQEDKNTKIKTPDNTYHKNNFKRPLTNQNILLQVPSPPDGINNDSRD